MMANSPKRDLLIGLAVLAVLVVLPFFFPSRYIVGQMTLALIWVIVASQWNLVFGVAGIFSLAHLALFAVGAYATAILGTYLELSVWVGIWVGGIMAVLVSLLIGLASLRLQGAYVALLTLAVAQALYVLIITDTYCIRTSGVTCDTLTGGARGLARFGDFGFRDWLPFRYAHFGNYFVALVIAASAMIFAYAAIHSPLGLAFKALRDNRLYAQGRGIDRFRIQLVIFGASAFFTGVAGGVYAVHVQVVGSNILTLPILLFVLSMIIIGGNGTFWGPMVGAFFLMAVDEGLKEIVDWRLAGLGLILFLAVLLMPNGIVGVLSSLNARKSKHFAAKRRPPATADPSATPDEG